MLYSLVMNIVFYGNTAHSRVLRLAQLLSEKRHEVTVFRLKRRDIAQIGRIGAVHFKYGTSFNPERPGGWLYLILTAFSVWRARPDVVHIFGWRAAALSRLLALLVPEATIVWTVDTIPSSTRYARFIARSAQRVCDAISTPTRLVQYQLLTLFDVHSEYVPDGYDVAAIEDVPVSYWGLTRGQYVVTTASTTAAITQVAEAYKAVPTKKKLVAMAGSRIKSGMTKKYPFLTIIEPLEGRSLYSLLRAAAVVVAANTNNSSETLLQTMDGARAIVAVNHSLYQELLGTTAQFVASRDTEGLQAVLAELVPSIQKQRTWGRQAQKRARTHFQWNGLLDEYLSMYHYPLVRRVPVDSVIAKPQFRTRALG